MIVGLVQAAQRAVEALRGAASPPDGRAGGRKKSGSSRFIVSSSGGCEWPVRMPVSSSSSSVGEDVSRSSSISISDVTRLCSSAASWACQRRPEARALSGFDPLPLAHAGPAQRSCCIVAHRPAAVQFGHVDLHRLPAARRHHGLALVVHLQHQLGGVRFAVAEQLLEHVGHVGHQVHRIVPDDGHPRTVGGLVWSSDVTRSSRVPGGSAPASPCGQNRRGCR